MTPNRVSSSLVFLLVQLYSRAISSEKAFIESFSLELHSVLANMEDFTVVVFSRRQSFASEQQCQEQSEDNNKVYRIHGACEKVCPGAELTFVFSTFKFMT